MRSKAKGATSASAEREQNIDQQWLGSEDPLPHIFATSNRQRHCALEVPPAPCRLSLLPTVLFPSLCFTSLAYIEVPLHFVSIPSYGAACLV